MYHKPRMIPYLLLLILLSTSAGCSLFSSGPKENPTAEALFQEGVAHFDNKKYARAIQSLQKFRDEFPFVPQIIDAELKLAEAYYLNKQYPEAVSAFKEFVSLHPTHEKIPFVVYHLGLVHFDQFNGIDRDPKPIETARGYFQTVAKDHPDSPYAQPAKEKLARCLEYLAEHELYIVSFYLREEKYPAARDRLEAILRRYQETPTAAKALYHLGESYRVEKNSVKAALAYEALLRHYPNSELAPKARLRLAELEKEPQDPLALLLMRDGRPVYVPPPETRDSKPETRNPNLVVKKDVVHEEPGNERGFWGRVLTVFTPWAWYPSAEDKKDGNHDKKMASAKGEPPGFLRSVWRALNPFARGEEARAEAPRDAELVGQIDAALKEQGIEIKPTHLESPQRPEPGLPTPDLPPTAASTPAPSNPTELLGEIDAKLKREGKDLKGQPSPPKQSPAVKASGATGTAQPTPETKAATPAPAPGLLESIDAGLKQKGIAPPKESEKARRPAGVKAPKPPSQGKIELEPKLPVEKGPLFLGPGEFRTKEKAEEEGK